MTIGDFLLRRLEEAGVGRLFGVQGDYNLELLQQLQDSSALKWVGTCNQLNASYAADGYARLRGRAALLVTNGVGALRAVDGIGGSCIEAVVSLRGTPRRSLVWRNRSSVATNQSLPSGYSLSSTGVPCRPH